MFTDHQPVIVEGKTKKISGLLQNTVSDSNIIHIVIKKKTTKNAVETFGEC